MLNKPLLLLWLLLLLFSLSLLLQYSLMVCPIVFFMFFYFNKYLHFIENQPVNIKIIISIKIFYSINCKNSSTSLFTYIKSKIMVIVTISIRK